MSDPQRTPAESPQAALDRTDELSSLLVDDVIGDAELRELNQLLEQDAAARERYVANVQLHCDLMEHFGGKPEEAAKAGAPPILSMLGGEAPAQSSSSSDLGQ